MWTCYLATFIVHLELSVLKLTKKGILYKKGLKSKGNHVKELIIDKILLCESYYRCFFLKTRCCYDLFCNLNASFKSFLIMTSSDNRFHSFRPQNLADILPCSVATRGTINALFCA